MIGPSTPIEWNAGVVVAVGTGLSLDSGTIANTETIAASEWTAGTVTATGAGLSLTGGTLAVEASQLLRSLPFSFVGTLASGQAYNLTLTQAGTLLANGGAAQAYIPVDPTATQHLTIETINSGTVTTQGTIAIATSGSVTFPSFSAVALAAGATVAIVNQATADATFANACISLQFRVT